MAPPSYARATASSTSKASPKTSKVKASESPKTTSSHSLETLPVSGEPDSPIPTPKKSLKRPSLLTSQDRDSIAYKRDLYPIRPKDPLKPCPLANLPSELRCHIYTFLLPSTWHIHDSWAMVLRHKQHRPPSLLDICRAIRIEAAYIYYTQTIFKFTVRNLNFEPVKRWMDALPKDHRALLGRNKRLQINIIPRIANTFTYPPPNYLVDGYMEDHWKVCQQFGNIYTVQGDAHKKHFLVFCRLARWWTWCSKACNMPTQWTYTFDSWELRNSYSFGISRANILILMFLYDQVAVLKKPCVEKAWRKTGNVGSMQRAAMEWLDALDRWYEEEHDTTDGDLLNEKDWHETMKEIKSAVERW
jgi:hypothetical protein